MMKYDVLIYWGKNSHKTYSEDVEYLRANSKAELLQMFKETLRGL